MDDLPSGSSGGCAPPPTNTPEDVGWPGSVGSWRGFGLQSRLNFLDPWVLLRSRNDRLAGLVAGLIERQRERWIAAQRARPEVERRFPDRVISRPDLTDPKFVVVGDTGEQDDSQWAVVPPLLAVGDGTDFMIIASDVVYPAGAADEYPNAFYKPYANYRGEIYAIPGNHDWYDGLVGFMYHFCGAEPQPFEIDVPPSPGSSPWMRARRFLVTAALRRLWRRAPAIDTALLEPLRAERWPNGPAQPGPYFAIDTPRLRIVAIDTGIQNRLDAEQAAWLLRVSKADVPKLLVTGKPIYVGGHYHPTSFEAGAEIEGYADVDAVVRDPEHRYVAVIGPDIHNYQRYCVRLPERDGCAARTIPYFVAGGGGAHLSPTHMIPRVDLRPDAGRPEERLPADVAPVGEDDFVCRPLRGDSLAVFSRVFASRLRRVLAGALALGAALGVLGSLMWGAGGGLGKVADAVGAVLWFLSALSFLVAIVALVALPWAALPVGSRIPWERASAYMAERIGVASRRREAGEARVGPFTRLRLWTLLPGPGLRHRVLYGPLFAPFFDHDEPPLFRSFLHVAVEDGQLVITCHGVSGYTRHETSPPVWDQVRVPMADPRHPAGVSSPPAS
jgi:hypothetical protein